jgi:hypothetical protein
MSQAERRLKMDIIKEAVRRYLETGDSNYLGGAFLWFDSPQGHEHWKDIFLGDKPLDEASRAWLEEVSR